MQQQIETQCTSWDQGCSPTFVVNFLPLWSNSTLLQVTLLPTLHVLDTLYEKWMKTKLLKDPMASAYNKADERIRIDISKRQTKMDKWSNWISNKKEIPERVAIRMLKETLWTKKEIEWIYITKVKGLSSKDKKTIELEKKWGKKMEKTNDQWPNDHNT